MSDARPVDWKERLYEMARSFASALELSSRHFGPGCIGAEQQWRKNPGNTRKKLKGELNESVCLYPGYLEIFGRWWILTIMPMYVTGEWCVYLKGNLEDDTDTVLRTIKDVGLWKAWSDDRRKQQETGFPRNIPGVYKDAARKGSKKQGPKEVAPVSTKRTRKPIAGEKWTSWE